MKFYSLTFIFITITTLKFQGQNQCPDISDYLKGEIFFESHKYYDAIAFFLSENKKNPNVTTHFYYSKCLFKLEYYTQALEANSKAIEIAEKCAELYYWEGQILKTIGSPLEAINSLNKANSLGYDKEKILIELSDNKILLKDFKNAQKDIDKLLAISNNTSNNLMQVELFLAQNKNKQAIETLKLITSKDSHSAKAYFLLALSYMEVKDLANSIEAYKKSSSISDEFSDPNITNGIEQYMEGNNTQACKTWKATGKLAKPLAKELIEKYCK